MVLTNSINTQDAMVLRKKEALQNLLADIDLLREYATLDSDPAVVSSSETTLKDLLKEDSTLSVLFDSNQIQKLHHLKGLSYRHFFIEFNNHGFVLSDIGNSNWMYLATAEDYLLGHHWDERLHTIDLFYKR